MDNQVAMISFQILKEVQKISSYFDIKKEVEDLKIQNKKLEDYIKMLEMDNGDLKNEIEKLMNQVLKLENEKDNKKTRGTKVKN